MILKDLISLLKQMKVETGSFVCLGCGHEHSCGTHGCAILRRAVTAIETLLAQLHESKSEVERLNRENLEQSLLVRNLEAERDAAVADLQRAEEKAEEMKNYLDAVIHEKCDYSVYTDLFDLLSDIVAWESNDKWRGANKNT